MSTIAALGMWLDDHIRLPDMDTEMAADKIVSRAKSAAEAALSGQVHDLGLALSPRDGDNLSAMIRVLAHHRPDAAQRQAIREELVKFCLTAPAVAPHNAADAARKAL